MNTEIPIVGKTYIYFDDGKIKPSRKHYVTITDIVPFNEIDNNVLNEWESEVNECYWLYAKETDFFIKADLLISNDKIENIIFVRTIEKEWFSLGWFGGILDVDGYLNAKLMQLTD